MALNADPRPDNRNTHAMTRHWKLSQIISISFVSLILIAAIVGSFSANSALLSDEVVPMSMSASSQGAL